MSVSSETRRNILIADLAQQSQAHADEVSNGQGFNDGFVYKIPLIAGDVLAIRVTYVPTNGDNVIPTNPSGVILGTNTLRNHTYKIFLTMV